MFGAVAVLSWSHRSESVTADEGADGCVPAVLQTAVFVAQHSAIRFRSKEPFDQLAKCISAWIRQCVVRRRAHVVCFPWL
jgi:hypothetical protein